MKIKYKYGVEWPGDKNTVTKIARWNKRTMIECLASLEALIKLTGIRDVILHTNIQWDNTGTIIQQKQTRHRGVIIEYKIQGSNRIVWCDNYASTMDNLHVIIRSMHERYTHKMNKVNFRKINK